MITKTDILNKCRSIPGLQPLVSLVAYREFTQIELEAIDFMIESLLSLKETIATIEETHQIKLQLWLSSIKHTD